MTLEFRVTGQHISWLNNTEHVVADSRNYVKAKFTFSEEWTYPATVLFKSGCKVVPVLLAQAGEEITVPPEVLKGPLMLVSCYCGDLITADSARVKIDPSGYTEIPEPSDPEAPSYYSQMIAYIDQINALIGEDAEAKDTLTKLQDVIDKAQDATTLPDQTVIGQMDALIDQYISNEDVAAYQILEGTIRKIKSDCKVLKKSIFQGVESLTEAYLPECTGIGSMAFQDCLSIQRIYAPKLLSIGANAIHSEKRIETFSCLYAPFLEDVDNSAFKFNVNLKKLDTHLKMIRSYAFSYSSVSTLIIRSADVCTLQSTSGFSNDPVSKKTGYVYVPRALIDDYKTATHWTVYADQIRAIEDYPDICAPEEWED